MSTVILNKQCVVCAGFLQRSYSIQNISPYRVSCSACGKVYYTGDKIPGPIKLDNILKKAANNPTKSVLKKNTVNKPKPSASKPLHNNTVKLSGKECKLCGKEVFIREVQTPQKVHYSIYCLNCGGTNGASAHTYYFGPVRNKALNALAGLNSINKQQSLYDEKALREYKADFKIKTKPAISMAEAVEANKSRDKCILCGSNTKEVPLLFGVVNFCPCTER